MASLRKARKFARQLGPAGYWVYARGQVGRAPFRVPLPGARAHCWLRPRSSDLKCFRAVFGEREYEFPGYGRPEVIVDAGAHIGLASLYFAERFPEARIFALEPEAENFALLERNCAGHPNIVPLRRALWSGPARLRVANPRDPSWSFRMEASPAAEDGIPAVSVPELMKEFGLDRIDVLKLDIEGGEIEVFGGAPDWLERVRVLVIELHDRFRVGCSAAFYTALAGRGFAESRRGENVFMARPAASR